MGQEKHQDGNVHYHAALRFSRKIDSRDTKYWDIQGEHPNVKAVRRGNKNWVRAVKYVTKEDQDPLIQGFDLNELEAANPGEFGRMVDAIKAGASYEELLMGEHLGPLIRHKRSVCEVIQDLAMVNTKRTRQEWRKVTCNIPEIETWLNEHIKVHRENPLPALWITGAPGVGKSSLIEFLEKYLVTYPVPNEQWLDGWRNKEYDLIVCDEFIDKQMPDTKLNKLADGKTYKFPTKGNHVLKQDDKTPMIVCSNYSMFNSYRKKRSTCDEGRLPLDRRFTEVYVPAGTMIEIKEAETEVI